MLALTKNILLLCALVSPLAFAQQAPSTTPVANISGEESLPCVSGFLPGPRSQYEADQLTQAAIDPYYASDIPGPSFNDGVDADWSGF